MVLCLLLMTVAQLSAKTDTLSYIGKQSKNDTTTSLNILKKFNWYAVAKYNDGTSIKCLTRKPDTLNRIGRLVSLQLTTDFIADTAVQNKIITLRYTLDGSVNVSLNRRSIFKSGLYAPKGSERSFTTDEFKNILFAGKYQRLHIDYLPYKTHSLQLDIDMIQEGPAEKIKKGKIADENDSDCKGYYYLAFGIVFIVLFIFFREKKENLYFALFCLFAALSYLWDGFHTDILYNLEAFLGVFSFEFLTIFFCKVLRNRERPKKILLLIVVAVLICAIPSVRYGIPVFYIFPGRWVLVLIIISLYLYVIAAAIYQLIKGIGQKKWEARVILLACLVPLIVFVIVFFGSLIVIIAKAFNSVNGSINVDTGPLVDYLATMVVYIYPLGAVLILGRRNGLNQRKLIAQVKSIQKLSEENLAKEREKQEIVEGQKEVLEQEVTLRTAEIVSQKEEIEKQHEELRVEKEKSEVLLRNILPEEVAEELKAKGNIEAKYYDDVTVMFTDFANFTKAGERMSPQVLLNELDTCFRAFDEIVGKYGIEKIKTIGDAYLAVGGLPTPDPLHAEKVVAAAVEINKYMAARLSKLGINETFAVRIGVHSGSVVAGIVGIKKFAYDIWGDTVNTAARMEQNSEVGAINISQSTYELVKEKFNCVYRGEIEAKNKGVMKMYFVR